MNTFTHDHYCDHEPTPEDVLVALKTTRERGRVTSWSKIQLADLQLNPPRQQWLVRVHFAKEV